MMIRAALILLFILSLDGEAAAQKGDLEFGALEQLQAKNPRPVAVLIMTDWCKFCHAMKHTMLRNKLVSELLEREFYVLFLDAAETRDIYFAGRKFSYSGGTHQLAKELGTINGQMSYPTLTVLNSKNEIVYQHQGFLGPPAMEHLFKTIQGAVD